MDARSLVLGLDVGGTKLAAGVVDSAGTVRSFCRRPSDAKDGPGPVLGRLFELGHRAIEAAGTAPAAIGIGCGGPLDPISGHVRNPPNLPGWDDVAVAALAAAEYQCPAFLENDGLAAAMGEFRFGGWGDVSSLLYLTISTGIGGGLVVDGRPYRGAAGNGGEFGHIVVDRNGRACLCGRRGCIEAYASGSSIARRAAEALDAGTPSALLHGATAVDVAAAAEADPLATRLWDETVAVLGTALADLVNVLEPQLVILGGGVTRAGDALLQPVRAAALGQAMPPAAARARIELSALGEQVGVLGAAAAALARLELLTEAR